MKEVLAILTIGDHLVDIQFDTKVKVIAMNAEKNTAVIELFDDDNSRCEVSLDDLVFGIPYGSAETNKYGIMGTQSYHRDVNGCVEVDVIVASSGMQLGGGAPDEFRIRHVIGPKDDTGEFALRYCAAMNRRADLPFCVAKAKVQVLLETVKIVRDQDLIDRNIKPLPKDEECE